MNENSRPKTPAINTWLKQAVMQLTNAGSGSPKLDAEIILAHTLRKSRTFLHAHSDTHLTDQQHEIADARLRLRLDRTPIAYIIGHKEFYGRPFRVTPATLIPRPESEAIITLLKEVLPQTTPLLPVSKKIVDVGTGTGCLGITTKLEYPELEVTLIDNSRHALNVAETNAKRLEAQVMTLRSNLLADYPFAADIIIANLPYVDPKWDLSPETQYEPAEALFAEDHGLRLIMSLLKQIPTHLAPHGHLLLEADPRQHEKIIKQAKLHSLHHLKTEGFVLLFEKP